MGLLLHVMSFCYDRFVEEVKYRVVTQRKICGSLATCDVIYL